MRIRKQKDGLSVHAIAGTRVVLLGLDIEEKLRKGLLGFTILRTGPDPENPLRKRTIPLKGGMHFKEADVWIDAKARGELTGQSDRHPIQAFLWGDYIAQPGVEYVYEVTARYGKPVALTDGAKVSVEVSTESEDDHTHAIWFNRGVAGSQAYARKFDAYRRYYQKSKFGGKKYWTPFIRPDDVPDRAAFKWLSHGLEEALLDFIAQAKDGSYALRVNAFEFTYMPFIQALVDATQRGVDVQVTYHAAQDNLLKLKGGSTTDSWIAKRKTISEEDWKKLRDKVQMTKVDDSTAEENHAAIDRMSFADPAGDTGPEKHREIEEEKAKIGKMLKPRRNTGGFSHNKVMILLKDDKPIQVWTGSTNYTEGGIFGQSNVGHVVRDPEIAQKYLDYWEQVHEDPQSDEIRAWTVKAQPDLDLREPPPGVTPVFSPRDGEGMLDWYAERFAKAEQSVFFTAAFSVASQIYEAATKPDGPMLRYLMLEKERAKEPLASVAEAHKGSPSLDTIANNRLAWGDFLKDLGENEEDMIEVLTGLNTFVNYLHTKYMLIDPLTDDPIVITGSANFSANSTVNNDENMLVIRGNTRVADIYLGEFMRLFEHFRIRNELNAVLSAGGEIENHLAEDDSWTAPYFDADSQLMRERKLFSGATAGTATVKGAPEVITDNVPLAAKTAPAPGVDSPVPKKNLRDSQRAKRTRKK